MNSHTKRPQNASYSKKCEAEDNSHHCAPEPTKQAVPDNPEQRASAATVRRPSVRTLGRPSTARELRRLTGALTDLSSDRCPGPHWQSELACTCREAELARLAVSAADHDVCLDPLVAFASDTAPWLVPALAALRSLCEGKLYEAGRSLPALAGTSSRMALGNALRRVRGAWKAGAGWKRSGQLEPLLAIEKATAEGATCALEAQELIATVRVAAGLG